MTVHEFGQPGADDHGGADPLERFADACGMSGVLRLVIRNFETGEQTKHDLHEPFAVIGSEPGCQVQLSHADVTSRHVYVQILQGRVHCIDLGSRTGLRFRNGLRTQGILTGDDSLVIGPYQIRLSQAPAYRMYATADGASEFENRHSDDAHLVFWNARDQNPRRSSGQLRSRITLIGRSGCCHIKFADDSVAPVQCSAVRTPIGDWIVNLDPDSTPSMGGAAIQCELLSNEETFDVGAIRVQFVTGSSGDAVGIPEEGRKSEFGVRRQLQHLVDDQVRMTPTPGGVQAQRVPSPADVHSGGLSEDVLVSAIERFGEMQRQILRQSHERSMMLTQIIGSMRQNQHAGVSEQIGRIQAAATELVESQRPRLEEQSSLTPDIDDTAEEQSGAE